MSSNPRFIEVYSGNRNRLLYPNQSSFVIPFSSSLQNVYPKEYLDQDVNGSIYFSYRLSSFNTPIEKGIFQEEIPGILTPTYNYAYLWALQNPVGIFYSYVPDYLDSINYSQIPNYYKGYTIINTTTGEQNIIDSYEPSSGKITFIKPFINPITPGDTYDLYAGYPSQTDTFIPYIDINNNTSLDYDGSYNNYYIVFETPNPNYSNSYNSNIFYRKISYYDVKLRLAYFDEPLPFDYNLNNTTQDFTIRKSLPIERWTLNIKTYNNTTPPINPLIGPLLGLVITLPNGASNIDNYYTGKYVYFYTNSADDYNPPYPNSDIITLPIPNTFYPIYGLYYIRAYNGTTKELSVCQDAADNSCKVVRKYYSPPTYEVLSYNSSSFSAKDGLLNPINVGGTTYESNLDPLFPLLNPYQGVLYLSNKLYETGRKYKFRWNIKYVNMISAKFEVVGSYESYILDISNVYQMIEFTLIPIKDILYFRFYMTIANPIPLQSSIVWDFFQVETVDTINICSFYKENAYPLQYNGSIVSQNQVVCYDIILLSITIPNVPLITGSTIAFYPYVYIELSNDTSPSRAASGIIYSNNPNSKRALFIAPIPQVANPTLGTFVTLTCNMKQTIKFKPNDNLLFRVFLPNGQLLQTLLPDILSPYNPDPRLQIEAVFSILRKAPIQEDMILDIK